MDVVTNSTPAESVFGPIRTNRRASIVWAAFIASITLVGGFLVVTDPSPAPRVSAGISLLQTPDTSGYRTILDTTVPVEHERWLGIVIDHTGHPHGSVETISRQAQADGFESLNYHFVIGNGNGMGDGQMHLGYRWNTQIAAAPLTRSKDPAHAWVNEHSIRIGMVGNGHNRSFTDEQMKRLTALILGLQAEFHIPGDRVRLAHEFASSAGPGPEFDFEGFKRQLQNARRGSGG